MGKHPKNIFQPSQTWIDMTSLAEKAVIEFSKQMGLPGSINKTIVGINRVEDELHRVELQKQVSEALGGNDDPREKPTSRYSSGNSFDLAPNRGICGCSDATLNPVVRLSQSTLCNFFHMSRRQFFFPA